MHKPNIILINCDDLGYGDLGCYGSKVNKTPNLDQMAKDGIRFTDFYMASSVCSPSRGAMMTGCYPPRIGFGSFNGIPVLFPGYDVGLNPTENTLPKQLKLAGYRTKMIGKWHCGDQPEFLPTQHGFDDYLGIPYSNDMGRQRGREKAPPLPLLRNNEVIQEQPDQRALTERYTVEAVEFIRNEKENPFFLYFAHMHVHVPIYVPKHRLEKSENGAYGAAVEHIDWSLSVLLAELKVQGLEENTLVIFTSDNGSRARDEGGSNAPLRNTKATTWEGGIRVPCIMKWPKKIKAGSISSELVTGMDFYPTLCELTGAEVPDAPTIDGKSISSLLFDAKTKSPHDHFVYYFMNNIEAVRMGDWKLHLRKRDEEIKELYNLKEDVGETQNLYTEHPEIIEKILKIVEMRREDIGDDAVGMTGKNRRPIGKVSNAKPLTEYKEDHPYIIAMYDIADGKVMAG